MNNYPNNPQVQYPSDPASTPPPPYNPSILPYPKQGVVHQTPTPYIHAYQPQNYQQLNNEEINRVEPAKPNNVSTRKDRIQHATEIMDFEPVIVGPCLWVLIIVGIFCCCILGLFALIFAALACFKEYSGRIGSAVRLAKAARVLAILSIVLGIVIIAINLLLRFAVPEDYFKYIWDGNNKRN